MMRPENHVQTNDSMVSSFHLPLVVFLLYNFNFLKCVCVCTQVSTEARKGYQKSQSSCYIVHE